MRDYLEMNIEYDLKKDHFNVTGNINPKGQREILDAFLRGQIGAGEDKSRANEQDVYHIRVKWFPYNDDITVTDDTGNKGLRDGILLHFLSR